MRPEVLGMVLGGSGAAVLCGLLSVVRAAWRALFSSEEPLAPLIW